MAIAATDQEIKEVNRKKAFLKRYKKTVAKIERLKIKLEELQNRMENIKAVSYSHEPRGSVRVTIDDLLADKVEYEKRIDKLKSLSIQYKAEITSVIDELEDTKDIDVLELSFIDCLDIDEVAMKMGYTTRYTIKLYSKAINKISLEGQYKDSICSVSVQ